MKLDIFSHCVIDTIYLNNSKYVVPGGPACYCSLTSRALKFDVTLHTKFGSDFSLADYLNKQKKILDDEGNNTWGSSGKCVFNDNYASSKNKKLRYIDSKTDTWTAVGFVYVDLRERGQDGGMSFCTLMFNKDDKKNIDKTISAFVSLGSLYSPGL